MALTAKQENKFLHSSLFSGCDIKSFHRLAQIMTPFSLLKGENLQEVQEQETMGFLLSGKLEVTNLHGVLYYNICPGEFIGMEDLFSEVVPVVECCVKARTNSVLTFVKKQQLRDLLEENAQIRENYLIMLADQVHHSVNRLQRFTAPTPGIALGIYLVQHEEQGMVRLIDGFAGLARRLNVSRATLYRSLAELEGLQLISHMEKTITILDAKRLHQYVHMQSDIAALLD